MSEIQNLQKVADTIRVLSAEAIQQANSGHPGLPLGCADIASVLYSKVLNHNPKDSTWINRDRFILSAGHGSMLLYSLLHLFNYEVSLDDLKNFRQLYSKTPGHPEYGHTHGVETTTGPLGQGVANAVGMAIMEKKLADKYNTSDYKIIDNHIYVLCGDGCMMEGIASEAASLAGHLNLNNITLIYDSNKITIEGSTDLAFTEDVEQRFLAYNWQVEKVENGNDISSLVDALHVKNQTKPRLIIAKTIIGFGSPNKAGTHKVHGAPLGEDETSQLREALNLAGDKFSVASDVYEYTNSCVANNEKVYNDWLATFDAWKNANPSLYEEYQKEATINIDQLSFPSFNQDEAVATRKSSNIILNKLSSQIPVLIGGSADLDCSNLSRMDEAGDINTNDFTGRNLHFGVREHAMGAICNGMQLYGHVRTYCATFLVFSDYMRHAIRLAALMKLPIIYIFTHDSIYVGEDGPTHQPIEHKASLEVIPNLTVIRPAGANEAKEAWKTALANTTGPTALLLTRQNVNTLAENADVAKGAYVAKDRENFNTILMASGSEVDIALDVADNLAKDGINIRVVSMPSSTLFQQQTKEYQEDILPRSVTKRIALDFGSSLSWHRYVGLDGIVHSIDSFGECGPGKKVADHFKFDVEYLSAKIKDYLA